METSGEANLSRRQSKEENEKKAMVCWDPRGVKWQPPSKEDAGGYCEGEEKDREKGDA